MKRYPTTQEEIEVARLNATLPSIYDYEQMDDEIDKVFESGYDYMSYNNSYYANGQWWECDYYDDYHYTTILETRGKWQIIRNFHSTYYCKNLNSQMHYHIDEISQWWIDEEGHEIFLAKGLNNKGGVSSRGKLCFRDENDNFDLYEMPSQRILISNVHDWIWKNDNVSKHIHEDSEKYYFDQEYYKFIFGGTAEFLWKCGYKEFCKDIIGYTTMDRVVDYMPFIRIAHRNHFDFTKNYRMWFDYLRMCKVYFDELQDQYGNVIIKAKDWEKQSFYVCPQDIAHAHEWITPLYNKRVEKKRAIEGLAKALKEEDEFQAHHAYLFGIEFQVGKYHFKSLDSIKEYQDEGKKMNHCVAGYYTHHDSLILHCSTEDTPNLATIEVDVVEREIEQINGVNNEDMIGWFDIFDAVESHMKEFPRPQKKDRLVTKRKAA